MCLSEAELVCLQNLLMDDLNSGLFLEFRYYPPLVSQMVKRLPTMRENWVQSLGWEDILDKEMATYSSILAGKIPWTEEPGGL